MTAEPLPQPAPATAEDLGHDIHFPLRVDDQWRTTCRCHWWWEIETPWWADK